MHDYSDNDNFPDPVQIIDDTDPPNAANTNTAPEGLLDRTKWLKNRLGPNDEVHTTGGGVGSYTVPAGVHLLMLEGCGGHGGGGGGANGVTGTNHYGLGGGGGGTAEYGSVLLPVTPGEVYAWVVGAGGTGGTAGNPGGDGTDTVFINGGATNGVVFSGASGGAAGLVDAGVPPSLLVLGGQPVRPRGDATIDTTNAGAFGDPAPVYLTKKPGEGGATHAFAPAASKVGMGVPISKVVSISLNLGGVGGSNGADSGTQRGGIGGGGGAASVLGSGGAGGNGGAGSAGAGAGGSVGISSAVAAGGGGGGGGSGAGSGGAGASGGTAGAGFLRILTFRVG